MVQLTEVGKTEFKSAVAEGMGTGQGIYGNPVELGTVQPAWQQPANPDDSAFFETIIEGTQCKIYAPYNFDLALNMVKLVIVTALRDNDKYGVTKGKRKLSVASA